MTHKELVEALAQKASITKTEAAAILKSLTETMSAELTAGGEVQLQHFGKFSVKMMPERTGRNPRTGEKITVGGIRQAKFSPSKALKERVK